MIEGLLLMMGVVAVSGLAAWLFLAGIGDQGADEPRPGRRRGQ